MNIRQKHLFSIINMINKIGLKMTHLLDLQEMYVKCEWKDVQQAYQEQPIHFHEMEDQTTKKQLKFLSEFISDLNSQNKNLKNETIIRFCYNLNAVQNIIKAKLKKMDILKVMQLIIFYQTLLTHLREKSTKPKQEEKRKICFESQQNPLYQENKQASVTRPSTATGYQGSMKFSSFQKHKFKSTISSWLGIQTGEFNNTNFNIQPYPPEKDEENEEIKFYEEQKPQEQIRKQSELLKSRDENLNKTSKSRQNNYLNLSKSQRKKDLRYKSVQYNRTGFKKTNYSRDRNIKFNVPSQNFEFKKSKKSSIKKKVRKILLSPTTMKDLAKTKSQRSSKSLYKKKSRQKIKKGVIRKKLKKNVEEKKKKTILINNVNTYVPSIHFSNHKIKLGPSEKKNINSPKMINHLPQNEEEEEKFLEEVENITESRAQQASTKQIKKKIKVESPYQFLMKFHSDYISGRDKENTFSVYFKDQEKMLERQSAEFQKKILEQRQRLSLYGSFSFPLKSYHSVNKEEKIKRNQRDYAFETDDKWILKNRLTADPQSELIGVSL